MDDASPGPTSEPTAISEAAEHAWEAAAPVLYPIVRPAGSAGLRLGSLDSPRDAAGNVEPLVDEGPGGLVVAYVLAIGGYDVLANGDHLAAWGVPAATLRETALRNLAAWSATAPWSEEAEGGRRILSSDTGDGWDASRILLPETTAHLERSLGGPGGRVLVGIPSQHLLIAGALRDDDPAFGPLFADFVLEYAGDSDDAIDRRVFELREGRLAPFNPSHPA
ncbi:MAG: DUF1444 family protein [Chloroflexi bacterium]|nr:DUF1444 family protein [Chloroflexota bacterium]